MTIAVDLGRRATQQTKLQCKEKSIRMKMLVTVSVNGLDHPFGQTWATLVHKTEFQVNFLAGEHFSKIFGSFFSFLKTAI